MQEEQHPFHIVVRGVLVPKLQIENIEQEFGAKLVPDEEVDLIYALDRVLFSYRQQQHKDPDFVQLGKYPGYLFKHMTLKLNYLGLEVPGPHNKPAWFRFKKLY